MRSLSGPGPGGRSLTSLPFTLISQRREAPSAFKAFVCFFQRFYYFFYFGAEALVAPFFGAELTLRDTVGEAPDAAKPALSGVTPIFFSLSHNNLFFFFSKPHAVSSCASIVGFFVKSACKTVSPR